MKEIVKSLTSDESDYNTTQLPATITASDREMMDTFCYGISLKTDDLLEGNEIIQLQLSSAEHFVAFTQDSAVFTITDSVGHLFNIAAICILHFLQTLPTETVIANTLDEVQTIVSSGNQTEDNLEVISMTLTGIAEAIENNNNITVNVTVSWCHFPVYY